MDAFREIISDTIAYWEPRRLLFNILLACVTISGFCLGWPESQKHLKFDLVLALIVLAALANLMYCTAYLVDVFVQLSRFRELWIKRRWLLFVLGTLLALALTTATVAMLFFDFTFAAPMGTP